MPTIDRRNFLGVSFTAAYMHVWPRATTAQSPPSTRHFPLQDPALIREMVTVAHGNVERVKDLLAEKPALAKAAVDWGFGDWEDALGAASHVGNREIAERLIASGARPTIFSSAMLGHVDAVRAFIAASPGVQRTPGPHSITLMAHARAGGERAAAVVDYLQQAGDADWSPPTVTLPASLRDQLPGTYSFGSGDDERLIIALSREQMTIQRPGHSPRNLRYTGDGTFFPVGAEHVRVRFTSGSVTILDLGVIVEAKRMP